MNELSIVDKLVKHFHHPDKQPLTEQMEEYLSRLEYCYDIVVKFPQKAVIALLRRKYDIGRTTAYNIYHDTLDFYEKEGNKSYKKEFWKITSITYLIGIREQARLMAKSPKDFAYVAKIESAINKLRGFDDKNPPVDPESLKPSTILISIASGNGLSVDFNIGQRPEGVPDNFPETIDVHDFTVEDMERELKKLGK